MLQYGPLHETVLLHSAYHCSMLFILTVLYTHSLKLLIVFSMYLTVEASKHTPSSPRPLFCNSILISTITCYRELQYVSNQFHRTLNAANNSWLPTFPTGWDPVTILLVNLMCEPFQYLTVYILLITLFLINLFLPLIYLLKHHFHSFPFLVLFFQFWFFF